MTLTEAAFWTKRFGVIALGVLLILILLVFALTWKGPTKPPQQYVTANFACTEKREDFLEKNKLEIPSLALAGGSEMYFEISTDTGKINKLPQIVNVYQYNNPTQVWDARSRAESLAKKMGFESDKLSRGREGYYEWTNTAASKTLSVNAKNQNFVMKSDALYAKKVTEAGTVPSEQEAKSKARNALNSLSLLNSDLSDSAEVVYITINPDGSFSRALSASEAHLVKVNFFRDKSLVTIRSDLVGAKDMVASFEKTMGEKATKTTTTVNDKKIEMSTFNTRIVLPQSQNSNISVYVGINDKSQKGTFAQIYQIEYTYWPLSVEPCGTYELVDPKDALEKIQNGEGSIAYLYDADGDDISPYSPRAVKKFIVNQDIKIYYYEAPHEQEFLQPVYVLSGEAIFAGDVRGKFDIYYPAIDYGLVQDKIVLPEPKVQQKKGLFPM